MKVSVTLILLFIFSTAFSQYGSHRYHSRNMLYPKVNSIKASNNKNKTILDVSESDFCDYRYPPCPAYININGYIEILSNKKIKGVTDINNLEYFKVNELIANEYMDIYDFPEMISAKCYDDTLMLPCDTLRYLMPSSVFLDKDSTIYSIYYNYVGVYNYNGGSTQIDHYTNKILYTKHKAVFQNNTIVRGELLKNKIYEDTAALTANSSFLIYGSLPLLPISSNIILSANPFTYPYNTVFNILDSNFNEKGSLDLNYTINGTEYNLAISSNYESNTLYIKNINDTIVAICEGYLDSLVLLKLDTGFNLISLMPYKNTDIIFDGLTFKYDSIANHYFDLDPELDIIPVVVNDTLQYIRYNYYDAQGNITLTVTDSVNYENLFSLYYHTLSGVTPGKKMVSLNFVNDSVDYSKMYIYVNIKDFISNKSKTVKLPDDYFKDGGYSSDYGFHSMNVPTRIDSFNNIIGFFNYEDHQTLGYKYNMALIGFNLDYTNAVSGTVSMDINRNCIKDSAENPVANILVELLFNGHSYFQNTDASGSFYISPYDTGHGKVILHLENQTTLSYACQDTFDVFISDTSQNPVVNFLVQTPTCGHPTPKLNVEISTPFLRRCFDNNYTLSVFNESNDTAFNSYVDLELDAHLIATDTAFQSAQYLGNNTYRFDLGTVLPLQTIRKNLKIKVDCDSTILGQTHCVKATAKPYDLCDITNEKYMEANTFCRNDSVIFQIKNIGYPETFQQSYRVIADDSIVNSGTLSFTQSIGFATLSFYNPLGKTYRLETRQYPMYPNEDTLISVTLEGCGNPDFSTGFVNLFPQDDDAPNVDIDCHQNVGSYDPNEKTAQPSGFGDSSYILPNTPLEYTIHFQNKGTYTASFVQIIDTLSSAFDITTYQFISSSHAFNYTIIDSNILQFTSTNINLPTEQNDTLGSNGYIKFKIAPKKNTPIGTILKNTASINFDFNPPIITNTVVRNINDDFIKIKIVSSVKNNLAKIKSTVYPNPFNQTATLSFDYKQATKLTIFSIAGKIVQQYNSVNNFYTIERNVLSNGLYLYELRNSNNNELLDTGKLVIQ